MKQGFFAGVLTGFVMAIAAAGWFVAAEKIQTPPVQVKEEAAAPATPRKDTYVYFAATPDGRIMQIEPLNQPMLTPVAIVTWTAQAVAETLTFGFDDRAERMQKNGSYFSKAGWTELGKAMYEKGWGTETPEQQIIYTTVPARAPTIRQQGVFEGRHRWVLEMTLLTTVKSPANPAGASRNYKAQVILERSSDVDSPTGVHIVGIKFLD